MSGKTTRRAACLVAWAVLGAAARAIAGPPYTWTDDPLTSSTRIRRVHFCELRKNVDDARSQLGMAAWSWKISDPHCGNPASPAGVRAADVDDIRDAIRNVYGNTTQAYTPQFSDGAALASGQAIRMVHVSELRTDIDQIQICGGSGAACCATGQACATGLTCIGNKCQAPPSCGTSSTGCCATGQACQPGLVCANNKCGACGAQGELCCPQSPVCQAGLSCTNGTCQPPMNCTPMPLQSRFGYASSFCPSNMPYVNTVTTCDSCSAGSSNCPTPPVYATPPRGMGTCACGTATCYQWNLGPGAKIGVGQYIPPYNFSKATTEGYICGYYVETGNSFSYGTCGPSPCATFGNIAAVGIKCCDQPTNPVVKNYAGCVPTTCSAPAPGSCGQTTTGMNDCGQPCTQTGPTCTYTQNTCTAQCTQCPAWVNAFSPPGCWPTQSTTLCTAGAGQTTTQAQTCCFCPSTLCIWKGMLTPGQCTEPPQGCCANNTPNN